MSNEREYFLGGPEAEVDVMLEPAPGHTDAELVERLKQEGAAGVAVLAPGYISARVKRNALKALEAIAAVHPKMTKGLHGV